MYTPVPWTHKTVEHLFSCWCGIFTVVVKFLFSCEMIEIQRVKVRSLGTSPQASLHLIYFFSVGLVIDYVFEYIKKNTPATVKNKTEKKNSTFQKSLTKIMCFSFNCICNILSTPLYFCNGSSLIWVFVILRSRRQWDSIYFR